MANIVHLLLIWILCVFTSCFSEYYCPKGAKIDRDGLRCYWMPAITSTWLEARGVCQRDERGDLALVDSVTVQTFIQNSFQLEAPLDVWMRNGMAQGLSDDVDVEDEIKGCTSMTLTSGQWTDEQCNKENLLICEKQISVSLPSLESFVTGVPLMSGIYTALKTQLLPAPPDPGPHRVEVMLFPGLWFSHEGRVLSLDLVTQPSDHLTFARVQILRPYCHPTHHLVPPGCSPLLNPFSCCSLMPMCNTTGGCAGGQYWCHLLELCLPVSRPCSPYHSLTGSTVFPLPPRYPAMPPFFHLMADMSLMLSPSPEHTHISVIVEDKHITVYPDDILAVQHTRRSGEFLHCVAGSTSSWRQSYLSLQGPEWGGWLEGSLSAQMGQGQWLDGVVCDLRVIYEDTMPHYAVSPIPSTSQSNNPIRAESPVTGLRVLHPKLDNDNRMHVAVNVPTLVVIQIISGENATSSWSAPVSKIGVPFVSSCPLEMPKTEGWFSHVYIVISRLGENTLNIMASNSVNSQTLSVRVVTHVPVSGLIVQPQGLSRVLVDVPQMFMASVVSGSSVNYTWVIDDLVQFPHTGVSYSVVFKKPAEYTLKVMANNPVSSQLIEVKLTADVMTPLADLTIISPLEAIAVNTSTRYTTQVKADISIGVTIRWDFGDSTASVSHPVPAHLEMDDSNLQQSAKHVFLQDSIQHTFSFPGDYTLKIKAHNNYDQIEKAVTIKVRTPISRLLLSSSPSVCQVNHTVLFEASLWPSTYGVLYSWNFRGDSEMKEDSSKVSHIFKKPGTYNVTVCADNTLSVLTNYTTVDIIEAISGLQLNYNGSIEVNCTFEISGTVSAGSHLKWTFEFGDGSVVKDHNGSLASHIYTSPGNYIIQVSAHNSVSEEHQLVNVEVYQIRINKIIPTDCIASEAKTVFEVLVRGHLSFLTFHWDFGDGTPLSVIKGASTITHTYLTSGKYSVSVTAHSLVASVHYETSICVETQITDVTLHSAKRAVAVSEEICFDVSVFPKVAEYLFWWHNNFSSDTVPVKGLSHHCFVFQEEGLFEISVQVQNKVSKGSAKTSILVQRPVSNLFIKYEGNHDAMAVNQSYYFWAELPGKIAYFQWDFGDGCKMEGQNQSHVFGFPGTFHVTVTASNAINSDSASTEIEVQVPLSYLMVNASQPFVEAGKEIRITAQTDVNENITFYWSVNTSSNPKLGMSSFTHVFPKAGVFQIKVAAQNLVSRVENMTHIEVVERIHGVQIQCQGLRSARYFPTNQTILLAASVTRGSNLTYEWTENQRMASNSRECPLFTNIPGDIHVRLVASNALGSADSELSLRSVELVSGPSISLSVNVVVKGKPVQISASVASGTDLKYSWFLDSEPHPIISDAPFVLHVFNVVGVVRIRVSVSNVFGSENATKLLTIQEDISKVDFQINGQFSPFFVASNSLLLLHGSAGPGIVLNWEWVVTFHNSSVMVLADNETVIYSFADATDHRVSLNVSNDISWQKVTYTVVVQDTIKGLLLTASSYFVCEDDPVTFATSVSQGSEVLISLEFVNMSYSVDIFQNFTISSLAVGNQLVRATAKNNVSYQTATVTVRVVERIKGLRLIGCCSAVLEASKNISFQVSSGSQANYHWTFLLNGVQSSQEFGKNVDFSPFTNGSLSVTVEADNGFCSQSLTSTATIQKLVKKVKLFTSHDGAFIDYPITFIATTDGGSDLKFIWDFGDASGEPLVTESSKQVHEYNVAAEFVVKLTAFNNISEVSTSMTIKVQKLACTQPLVYVVKEQYKILKSRPSFFEARVNFNGCVSHKASYFWEIFKGQDCSGMDKVSLNDSVDVTTPLLSLPKNSLKVGNYCLTFTARLQGTPLQQNRTIKLNVVHSRLVPVIKGGSLRLWSSQLDLILDATESFDPDSEENDTEFLQFQWSYIIENTTALSSAVSTIHHRIPGNDSMLFLPKSALLPDKVYHFTLTLYKSGRQPVSVSQSVKVSNITLLPVTVKCVSCNSHLSFHVSHSHHVALTGHCSSCQGTVQYRWAAENQRGEALTLNEVTTSTGSLQRDIVIKPGALMEGQEYTFTLNVSDPASGLWGSASITLFPNHPPYGGFCTLSPDSSLHFLETMVSYSCSGWMDDDGDAAQLIFSLQVAQCEDFGPLCPLITLYRGSQNTFSSLVPLGSPDTVENSSVIHVLVLVEDDMGAIVVAERKKLTVLLCDQCTMEWLRNKSQSEFGALLLQGNPQDIMRYSVALTSQLNQPASVSAQELEDKIHIRGNVIQALLSLAISSFQDAALISSALAQATVVPSEVHCNGCHAKVLKVTEKMIKVIGEQTGQGDINPADTGRNILTVLSSTMTAEQRQRSSSGLQHEDPSDTAVSALGQISQLMRSLMLSRMSGETALSLAAQKINAVGVRGDPTEDLLCTDRLGHCLFHIPSALSSRLKEEKQEVLQILLQMEGEENPLTPGAEPPISTTLAALEFATPQGKPISIANLTPDTAIQFTLHKKVQETEEERLLWKNVTLPAKGSVNFTVKAIDTDPQSGLYIALNFSLIPGSDEKASGLVWISLDDQPVQSLSEDTHSEEFSISLSSETPLLQHSIFLTPLLKGSAKDLFVTVKSGVSGVDVCVSVCVFSTLCRFFSVDERRWRSDGLSPLRGSSPHTAHCLTQHLTMFGASLFIHPDALLLLPPSEEPVRNVVVGIVCGVLLLIHLLVGLIAHKLDHLESLRLCWVPLCGQRGRYRYRVLVKTGWKRGSGTTAHVGISLYGLNKSGSRHLQRDGAFQRNGLDDFQVETDANLGEIWKIRIWHDNTGLDPSWFLQHVVVWDIQTDNMFFFLVEDWLSVENEKNSGRVEKVILASCPQELQQFKRILHSQFLFGLREHHLWISLWERPAHSCFSRAQRVTCCALLLHLYLAAGAVWYGAVGRKGSRAPVSAQMGMNAENVLVGMTVAALTFPIQTILKFMFQKTKSKVTLEMSLPSSPVSHTVEMDVFLTHPDLTCSSFLSLPTGTDPSMYDGLSPFTNSFQSKKLDSEFWKTPDPHNDRVDQWPSCDSIFGLPELMGTSHLLKRKKAVLQLHLLTPTSDNDTTEPFKSSEEDLRTISADLDPTNTGPEASDSGHFTPDDTILSDPQDSVCSEWSDLSVDTPMYEPDFHKSSSSLSVLSEASTFLPSLPPDSISTISNTRIGVVRGVPGLCLPSWFVRVLHLLVAVLLGFCLVLVGLYGSSFSSSVLLMWLVSTLSAFLTSALLLEPFAALYLAAVVKPVDPEVEERLAQETEVRRTEHDLGDKVHPLSGYGLLQAKEEARKLRTLRGLMRSCLVYMLFLLVVLMVNYQEHVQEVNGRRLQSAIKHTLISTSPGQPRLTALSGWMNAEQWINERLISHLYENPSLLLTGPARLQKVHSQDFCSEKSSDQFQSGLPLMLPAHVSSHASPGQQTSSTHSKITAALSTWLGTSSASCAFSQTEEVVLGNNSESTRQILSDLQTSSWMTTGTKAVLIEFTQYHKQTGILAPVSILLDQTQTGRIIAFISIQPFHISPLSAPDFHVTLTALLLLFALSFVSVEVWALIRKPSQYLRRAWCWFQPLLALLTLAAAVLRLYFLYTTSVCVSRHRSSFADFHSAATLARKSSQLSAVLLTLLVLKYSYREVCCSQMVGILRFVRRWLVIGRIIPQVFPQICGLVILLLLLLLLFSHTGIMLFSGSVDGFRTLRQASSSLLCLLRGHMVLRQLCEHHPVIGPLYCLSAVGIGFWVVGRLCAAMLIRTYQMIQADIYRLSMEPQDYEMVHFLLKRLKLWMGLSKTKEFRHRVKFEGMLPPPSRSSQGSETSNSSVPLSSISPRQTSSASSLASDSSAISDTFDFHHYVERLVPCVDSLLSGFDRVNQLTEEVYSYELQLQQVQSRISQRRKLLQHQETFEGRDPTPKPRHPAPSVLETNPTPASLQGGINSFSCRRATHSESSLMSPVVQLGKRKLSELDAGMNSPNSGVPTRRAWNSVTCHSASRTGSHSTVALPARPWSEDRDRQHVCDHRPIKRRAWQTE